MNIGELLGHKVNIVKHNDYLTHLLASAVADFSLTWSLSNIFNTSSTVAMSIKPEVLLRKGAFLPLLEQEPVCKTNYIVCICEEAVLRHNTVLAQ